MGKNSSTPRTQACSGVIELKLPYPPSANKYWRRVGQRLVLSRAARQFRRRVYDLWFVQKYVFRRDGFGGAAVALKLLIHPPDRRKRDLDNLLKPICDAVAGAGLIEDDSQIRRIEIEFGPVVPDGMVLLNLARVSDGG